MRTETTLDERAFYQEHGFVILDHVFDAGEIEHWRRTVTAAVERRSSMVAHATVPSSPRTTAAADGESSLGDPISGDRAQEFHDRHRSSLAASDEELQAQRQYYDRVFVQRVNLWQTDEACRALVLDERIGQLAGSLAGLDAIRLYHDQALLKGPWSNPTAFHLDVPFWSFTSRDALSMWIPLDDATPENGCLYFMPGTHKSARFDNVLIGKDVGALFEVYPEWRAIDPIPCPMPAGSVSFHNGLTAHGAGANMTARPRRAMTLQFMPDGATFNGTPSVLPVELANQLSVGDRLDSDFNPLLWSRSETELRVEAGHELSVEV